MGDRLWGVRLDTSRDAGRPSLWPEMGDFDPRGVNPRLVRKVRDALDASGFERVKIVVSGGFDVDRIPEFDRRASRGLLRRRLVADPRRQRFTADVVLTDGLAVLQGRPQLPANERLELVD